MLCEKGLGTDFFTCGITAVYISRAGGRRSCGYMYALVSFLFRRGFLSFACLFPGVFWRKLFSCISV